MSSEPHTIRSERYRGWHQQSLVASAEEVDSYDATRGSTKAFESQARLRRVPRQHHLGYLSTSSLTINRIIGTGIFVSPAPVLALTGSKTMALVLWLVGGIITWASMAVYLEYGIRWPLTGGELHYIHRVWTWPRMFFTYLYSFMFVILAGSHSNALVFGSSVLNAAAPGQPIDRRLQKLLAILIVASVCLFQSFSRLNYIRFSNLFAIYKVVLLSIITIIGWAVLGNLRSPSALPGPYGLPNLENDISSGFYSSYGIALSLLLVIRAFTGYENVNYVLEEVQRPPKDRNRVYRRAMEFSIVLVTFFYIMVNIAFFAACSTEEILASPDILSLFFSKVFGHTEQARISSGVLLTLSSAGNIMSATYTNVRVKQEIARMGIIPVPEFWASVNKYGTPGPALLLHFIFSAIFILIAPLGDPNGFLVFSTLTNYCRTVVAVLLGLGLMAAPWHKNWEYNGEKWKPHGSRILGSWLVYPLALVFVLSNLFIFILYWFPANLQDGLRIKSPILSSYMGPATCMSIYGGAVLYWCWDKKILGFLGYKFTLEDSELVEDEERNDVVITFYRTINKPAKYFVDFFAHILLFIKKLWVYGFDSVEEDGSDAERD